MALKFSVVTAPVATPISADEAKGHSRIDISDDDELVGGFVQAATDWVETFLRRSLVTRTYDLFLDAWPNDGTIVIPRPPLVSVASVKYTDDVGSEATLASSNYVVDVAGQPGSVVLKAASSWPNVTLQVVNGVVVRFDAGYGLAVDVPQVFKQAIYLLTAHFYEFREQAISGTTITEVPMGVKALLSPYRDLRFPE